MRDRMNSRTISAIILACLALPVLVCGYWDNWEFEFYCILVEGNLAFASICEMYRQHRVAKRKAAEQRSWH